MPLTGRPPRARRLAIGRLAFLLDGADLRYVTLDSEEIVRRIYVTVRDEAWGTVEADDPVVEVRELVDGIAVSATGRHRSEAADVTWTVRAHAAASGELSYAVELAPIVPFAYARMGLCLLHPPEAVIGCRYAAVTEQGELTGDFPAAIGQQRIDDGELRPLIPACWALRVEQGEGKALTFHFEGDLFETEDQRNWSDGSFKTYCTPLSKPRPQRAHPGRLVYQRIELTPPARQPGRPRRGGSAPVSIEIDPRPTGTAVPGIGLALGGEAVPASAEPLLQALGLEHVRVDVRQLEQPPGQLACAAAIATAVNAHLTVALHVRDPGAFDPVADWLSPYRDLVAWLVVFDDEAEASRGALVTAARARLAGVLPRARFAGGTDRWFAELNRSRPDPSAMDGVAWRISPQVHASDELTMVEALGAQADQVASARGFAPRLDLLVGPVTLRPRYDPYAPNAAAQAIHPPPASVDPRQGDLFAAAWTAGSLAQLAGSGATSVTYYETAGPRGVLATGGAAVLPCWHPLADAGAWRGWDVLRVDVDEPLAVAAIAARDPAGKAIGVLVANLRHAPTEARMTGLPRGMARLRVLDEQTCRAACADPLAFRASASTTRVSSDHVLALAPYAVATLSVGDSGAALSSAGRDERVSALRA